MDGAVTKYGGIDSGDEKYTVCCQQLFDICVDELKVWIINFYILHNVQRHSELCKIYGWEQFLWQSNDLFVLSKDN